MWAFWPTQWSATVAVRLKNVKDLVKMILSVLKLVKSCSASHCTQDSKPVACPNGHSDLQVHGIKPSRKDTTLLVTMKKRMSCCKVPNTHSSSKSKGAWAVPAVKAKSRKMRICSFKGKTCSFPLCPIVFSTLDILNPIYMCNFIFFANWRTNACRYLRAVSYQEFTLLVHGFLGKRRIPLPACAYFSIRSTFKAEEEFTGFEEEDCE